MNDATYENLKKMADRDHERRERKRPCCKNCAWFGDDTCFRYPPVMVGGEWIRPKVDADTLCGEFMHRTTGDTFTSEHHRIATLRSLVGELEDRIDRMKDAQQ